MSRYKVKTSVVDKISELMFNVLGRENSKEKFTNTINEVLSPTERLMVGKRILIMYMVFIGINYTIICDVVKVSRATIAKFAFLLDRSISIKETFSIVASSDRYKNTIKELLSSVFEPGLSLGSWENSWKLKRRIQEQKKQGF